MTLIREWLKDSNDNKPPHLPAFEDALLPVSAKERDLVRGEECSNIILQYVLTNLHDIKGALTTISLALTALLKKPSRETHDRKRLNLALQQVESITETIESIFLSIKRGYVIEHKTLEDIHVILERCLQNVRYAADTHQILLSRDYYPTPLPVLVNPEQIEQSLTNICRNAIEAMQPNGKLSLATYLLSDTYRTWVAIRITDTGVGIVREKIENIFTPFYTTKERSAGLGLYIAQKIITDHQGTIEVTSQQSIGTSFLINLPVGGGSYVTENPHS